MRRCPPILNLGAAWFCGLAGLFCLSQGHIGCAIGDLVIAGFNVLCAKGTIHSQQEPHKPQVITFQNDSNHQQP